MRTVGTVIGCVEYVCDATFTSCDAHIHVRVSQAIVGRFSGASVWWGPSFSGCWLLVGGALGNQSTSVGPTSFPFSRDVIIMLPDQHMYRPVVLSRGVNAMGMDVVAPQPTAGHTLVDTTSVLNQQYNAARASATAPYVVYSAIMYGK